MFKVKNEGARTVVYIYGTIGEDWWNPEDENRAKAFAQTLDELSPKPLDIRIDSGGGDVYEGFAIASAIMRYEGETHAYVDGLAASAASYIALSADRVSMNDYAMIMIHNAWAYTMGNRDELREVADRLEQLDLTIAKVIAARSGMDLDEVAAAMAAETWYSGPDALEKGLCDEVIETEQRLAASLDRAIAGRYRNIPEGVTVVASALEGFVEADEVPPAPSPAEPADDAGTSHGESNIRENGEGAAKRAVLLGNRLYRKEN